MKTLPSRPAAISAGMGLAGMAITLLAGGDLPAGAAPFAASATPGDPIPAIIQSKFEFYNRTYPEIRFVHLKGGTDWHGEMVALTTMLGSEARALDYEHPPRLRGMVMEATMERLRSMLEHDIVSATLFRVGRGSVIDRPNLCVITLNPGEFVSDDYRATHYMLEISDDTMRRVHESRYLSYVDQLEFAVDHEVFHCLDSFFHGGAPLTDKPLGGEYNLFRRETAADAYAMAMHIRSRGGITPYARNITHIRALWLFSDSPNRCTFETIREVLRFDPADLSARPLEEIIGLAIHLRDKTVGDYQTYVRQRAAALEAARRLGLEPRIYGEAWGELETAGANPALVGFLVNRYRFYYQALFTDQPVPLEAPPATQWVAPSTTGDGD